MALNWKDGTTPQLKRYLTGGSAGQGISFGSLDSGVGQGDMVGQRVIRFGGASTFIAVVGGKIHRSTNGGASWTEVHSDAILTGAACTGPYVLYPGGVATLVVLTWSTSTTWHLFTSTDGVTWAKSSGITLFIGNGGSIQGVVNWRGTLYGFARDGSSTHLVSWTTTSAAVVSGGVENPASTMPYPLCVWQDRLFTVAGNVGGDRKLYELVSGSWVAQNTFLTGAGTFDVGNKWCLFVDPATDEMICFVTRHTVDWKCFSFDANLDETDISSAVGASLLGSAASHARLAYIADGMDPGQGSTTPNIWLYFALNGTAGTPMTMFKWNGVGNPITNVGAGGNVQHAMPWGVQSGGYTFWTDGQRHVDITRIEPGTGGVLVYFKIYSPLSTDPVKVLFYHGDANREYPGTPKATLSAPSAGSLTDTNTAITGLDAADNGSTEYSVTWQTGTDGYSPGDLAKLVAAIRAAS